MADVTGGAHHARPELDGSDPGSGTRQRAHDRDQTSEPRPPGGASGDFTIRSGDEIIERFWSAGDPFGWERETLLPYLTRSEADFLADSEWDAISHRPRIVGAVLDDVRAYLDYTWNRILNHRFNEAQRSMFKVDYWTWLLGYERLAFTTDDFDARRPFCMPQLAAAAETLGAWPPHGQREGVNRPVVPLEPDEADRLTRMAAGLPCTDGCAECAE